MRSSRADGNAAIKSISTSVSVTSRPVVPMVVRGGGVEKNSRHTSSKAKKLFRSVRNTCAFTTRSSEVPAALHVFREVLQHVARLALDARAVVGKRRVHARLARHADLEVAGQLAGREDQIADHDRLRVGGERPRPL